MAIVNAKQFCTKTGFPLATLRAYCREGKVSHWKRGRVYWLDENSAIMELEGLKDLTIFKRKIVNSKPKIVRKVCSGTFDYQAEIARMKRECKSSYIAASGDNKKEEA